MLTILSNNIYTTPSARQLSLTPVHENLFLALAFLLPLCNFTSILIRTLHLLRATTSTPTPRSTGVLLPGIADHRSSITVAEESHLRLLRRRQGREGIGAVPTPFASGALASTWSRGGWTRTWSGVWFRRCGGGGDPGCSSNLAGLRTRAG
jgi:hypothetical protein